DRGTAFIAMEYVEGETLRQRLRKGPIPTNEGLAIAACLLEALGHAHFAGVLHRDIKPENIMLTGARRAKLLDFGLAKQTVEAGVSDGPSRDPNESSAIADATTSARVDLTMTGAIAGTF